MIFKQKRIVFLIYFFVLLFSYFSFLFLLFYYCLYKYFLIYFILFIRVCTNTFSNKFYLCLLEIKFYCTKYNMYLFRFYLFFIFYSTYVCICLYKKQIYKTISDKIFDFFFFLVQLNVIHIT